ncbi:MAG TPA: hypothetical protein VMV53_11025 [Acidimicrobiales bacterium]|nr:hypothetical protein [Acidimicrobiales bacterium]
MTRPWSERLGGAATWLLMAVAALALPLAAGFGFARLFAPTLHSRYFPWITGRALGIAGYVALCALVALGIWIRHPWRFRWPLVHGETRLRLHVTLAVATLALVVGHLTALASDAYAGVGWRGAFIPGLSQYRTFAVALGVTAFLFMVLLAITARSAGRLAGRHWLSTHRLALATFVLVWFHGVLAGTDTSALRIVYALSGAAVAALAFTRYVATQPAEAGHEPDHALDVAVGPGHRVAPTRSRGRS